MGWGLRDEHVLPGEFHVGLQRCEQGPAVALVVECWPGLLRAWPPPLPGRPAASQDTQGSLKWPWPRPARCPSAGAGWWPRPQLPAPTLPPAWEPASGQARRLPRPLSRDPADGRPWEAVCCGCHYVSTILCQKPCPRVNLQYSQCTPKCVFKGYNFYQLQLELFLFLSP